MTAFGVDAVKTRIYDLLKATGKRYSRSELADLTGEPDRAVRRCIESLRRDDLVPICSCSDPYKPGYWIAKTREEYTDFIDREYRSRLRSARRMMDAAEETVGRWEWDG